MSVAHEGIDLAEPSENHHHAGFTEQERDDFTELLDAGFIDTYRYYYPNKTGMYTYWSYRGDARPKNEGWRLDYFLVSDNLEDKLESADILTDVMGSDHCPVSLKIDLRK